MHFAFLGLCPESRQLAAATLALGHRVTWYLSQTEQAIASDLLVAAGGLAAADAAWESLLDDATVDGIVLAEASEHDGPLRNDQWRRLAQAGAAMLVVHPVVESLLVYLEVDMLIQESGAVLSPYIGAVHSAEMVRFQSELGVERGELQRGGIDQLVFRRHLLDRSPRSVTRWFARDVVLLDQIAGPFTEIGAMGPDASAEAYATLAVQLHGAAKTSVRWEVARASHEAEAMLLASGPDMEKSVLWRVRSGKALPPGEASSLDGFPPHRPTVRPMDDRRASTSEALAAVADFEQALASRQRRADDWRRAVRAMELADSIEISLRRGRKIDVYYRQMTEETSYKGLMSAVGCGLLLLAPLVLGLAGVLNAVFGWQLMRFWYVPVLSVFVGFLVLQVLARIAVRWLPAAEREGSENRDVEV